MPILEEKEVLLLNTVSKRSMSQRELAKKTGVSLGLINVILKRLTETGYINVSQVNKRKLQYLLTPQGLVEATKKTYEYTLNTIKSYKAIEKDLTTLLLDLHKAGYDYFSIQGDGELRDLLLSIFQRCLDEAPVSLGTEHRRDPRAVLLNLTMESPPESYKGDVVNVLEKIGYPR